MVLNLVGLPVLGTKDIAQQRVLSVFYPTPINSILKDSFQDLLRTERVGFEPTRVLPLHDFESCAFNRALPPLQTLYQRFPTLKRHGLIA